MSRYFAWKNILIIGAILCAAVTVMMAHPQRPGGNPPPSPREPLGLLKQALSEAGASALTSSQEQQLTQLIETMRAQRPRPNETLQAAQRAFDNAVLAGNEALANAQAEIISQQLGADAGKHLHATAKFKIAALNILKSDGNQLAALTQRFGTAGLPRLLDELAGGGPHHRPGGPPPPPPPPFDGRSPAERP